MAIGNIKKEVGGGISIDSNEPEADCCWDSIIFYSFGVWASLYGMNMIPYSIVFLHHSFQHEALLLFLSFICFVEEVKKGYIEK